MNNTLATLIGSIFMGSVISSTALDDATVVARIGESDVKLAEVREALAKLDLKDQATLGRDAAALNQVVRVLLVQRLMLSEAKAKKFDETPEIKAAMQRARDLALSEGYLASVSEPPQEYPSEAELLTTFENVKPQISSPKQWRLAQIYVAAPPEIGKEELKKAEAKLAEAKKALEDKTADFAKVASAHSDDKVSAAQGGEIGWLAEEGILQDIRTEATLLKVGEVSKPIRMKDGWHILKCLEIRDAFVPKLEDVKDALRTRMRDERMKENSKAFVAKLLQENPLSINEIAIKEALKKPEK
jgi:parvulin-like peptidyl-prolyl isomerase